MRKCKEKMKASCKDTMKINDLPEIKKMYVHNNGEPKGKVMTDCSGRNERGRSY